MTGIYCIENVVNGKKYIGQAVNIEKRWKDHIQKLRRGNHYNPALQNAWNKYGEYKFSFYVVELCAETSLNQREIEYIEQFDSYDNGYNLTKGGEGTRGFFHTEEYKRHMSDLCKGKTFSEETLQKMSAAKKGKPQEMTQNRIEGRKKAREKMVGVKKSAEHNLKNSIAHLGQIPWNKGKKMGEGYVHPMLGKHHTDETKEKISLSNKGRGRNESVCAAHYKPVFCVEEKKVYKSITDAANAHSSSIYAISKALTGKAKTSCGLHWEYAQVGVN